MNSYKMVVYICTLLYITVPLYQLILKQKNHFALIFV